MKKLSKIFMAVFLVLAILMTTVPAFAAEAPNKEEALDTMKKVKEAADKLHDMGILSGTDSEEFDPDLSSSLTREQGISMAVKLMGLESKAIALTDDNVSKALKEY